VTATNRDDDGHSNDMSLWPSMFVAVIVESRVVGQSLNKNYQCVYVVRGDWCRILKRIESIQNYYLDINILKNLMPLTSSQRDSVVMTQALSLLSCLLFNANITVQVIGLI